MVCSSSGGLHRLHGLDAFRLSWVDIGSHDLEVERSVPRPAGTKLRETERRAIVGFFDEALADVDAILRGTTQLLSRLTRYASLALAPSQRESAIIRSELIRLGTAVLLLVVFDTGHVEKRV